MTKWRTHKMAVLGFHVVLSMIVCVVWSKLRSVLSVSRYIKSRLWVYFVIKEDDEPEQTSGSKKKKTNEPKSKIYLGLRHISEEDCQSLQFYAQFCILLNLMCATVVVCACTWLCSALVPRLVGDEANLALLWVAVLVAYCSKSAFSITALFFRPTMGSEGKICAVCAVAGFVCSVCVLSLGGDDVAPGLPQGILSLYLYMSDYVALGVLGVVGHVALSLVAGALTGALVFPSFRLAQQHCGALVDAGSTRRLLCYGHLCSLLLAALLQLRSVVRYAQQELLQVPEGSQLVEMLHSALLALHLVLRAVLAVPFMQAYLDTALRRLPRPSDRRDNGSELASAEQAVHSIFRYLGVVLLQWCTSTAVLACGLLLQTGLARDMARWPLVGGASVYLLNFSVAAMSVFSLVGMAYFTRLSRRRP